MCIRDSLVTDILSKAVASNQGDQNITTVDLNLVIDEVIGNLKNDISMKNATINYVNLPSIYGYKSDFVQLFQNMISNSLKYSRANIDTKIEISSKKENGFHLLSIEDNGQGISENALERIFDKWDRGDANDNQGHGIGLSTCKKIVEEYNGTIIADSKVGIGTVFSFKIKDLARMLEPSV